MEDKSAKQPPEQKPPSGAKPVQREITYNIGRKRGTIRSAASGTSAPEKDKESVNRSREPKAAVSAQGKGTSTVVAGEDDHAKRVDELFRRYLWRPVSLPADKTVSVLLWSYAVLAVGLVGWLVATLAHFS